MIILWGIKRYVKQLKKIKVVMYGYPIATNFQWLGLQNECQNVIPNNGYIIGIPIQVEWSYFTIVPIIASPAFTMHDVLTGVTAKLIPVSGRGPGPNLNQGMGLDLTSYVKVCVVHASGLAGTLSPPPTSKKPLVSNPSKHHGTCVTYVPWCMSGSLTGGYGDKSPLKRKLPSGLIKW